MEGWTAEPKVDGWRAIVTVEDGSVRIRSRSGRLLNAGVDHLDVLTSAGDGLVLDAELAIGSGHPDDFHRVSSALSRHPAQRVTLWVFDLLWEGDRNLCRTAHADRRHQLEEFHLDRLSPSVRVVPSFPAVEACALFAACDAAGMEGVVLKDGRSRYLPGRRSSAWRKLKCSHWREHHAPGRLPAAARRARS